MIKNSPSFFMDFARGGRLDPRLVFNRSTSGYVDSPLGLIERKGAGRPRFSYDPADLRPLGIVLEDSVTYLSVSSNGFDGAAWSRNNCTADPGATVSPDGSVNGYLWREDTSTSTHALVENINVVSGTAYTRSLRVKRPPSGQSRNIRVVMHSTGFGSNVYATFDLANVAATASNCTAKITARRDGWLKLSVTAVATASVSCPFPLYLDNGSGILYTGDGASGLYIFGAQLYGSDIPLSYGYSSGSQTTRLADSLSLASRYLSGMIGGEGTILAVANIADLGASDTRYLWRLSNSLAANQSLSIRLGYSSGAKIRAAGVDASNSTQYAIDSATVASGRIATAFSWSGFNFSALSVNGLDAVTDLVGTMPSGWDGLSIGSNGSGNTLNGELEIFALWPVSMSAADLKKLSGSGA